MRGPHWLSLTTASPLSAWICACTQATRATSRRRRRKRSTRRRCRSSWARPTHCPRTTNTAVKSERSNYYDAGAAYQLTPQITLGVDGYYRNVQHLRDEGQFGNALILSALNYAKGQISGLEFSTTYHDKVCRAMPA